MNEANQPYNKAAAELLARHNTENPTPEQQFNRAFLKNANFSLRPLPMATTEPLRWSASGKLTQVMNDFDPGKFRAADAPHTCAACAMQMIEDSVAGPCI
jgi:uncharacterized protein YdgA (DUF945 family)